MRHPLRPLGYGTHHPCKDCGRQFVDCFEQYLISDETPDYCFHVGDRSRQSARKLWGKIPRAYRQQATFYTDQYVVYEGVIPAAQHRAISKKARKTNHIERFNNTLRQRVSRLVRSALSFSKKLANHIGAIKLFICHYNLTRAVA